MDRNSMEQVLDIVRGKSRFIVAAHVNPEGDATGSQLAFYHILKQMGKEAVMVAQDPVPYNLKFLPGIDGISESAPAGFSPEAAIVLDCPVLERVGAVRDAVAGADVIVNIDHHVSNARFGDVNWVEPEVSSVGEMVYILARELEIRMDRDIAEALYTAIVTDTGMFNYDNTGSGTHQAISGLIEAGVRPYVMYGEIFEKKRVTDIRVLGKVLSTIRLEEEGRLAHMSLTLDMYRDEGVESVYTDEFINFPRSIHGVEVTVFFRENPARPGEVNVSLRSGARVNINEVAAIFGGGGHARAAGCRFDCGLDEARDKVLKAAAAAIREADDRK